MNVAEKLTQLVFEHPDRIALIDAEAQRSLTFRQLDDLSARGAALLQAHGLKAGGTVAVAVPVCAELYVIVLSLFRSGLTALFMDFSRERPPTDECKPPSFPAAWIVHERLRNFRHKATRGAAIGFTIGYEEPEMISWSHGAEIAPCREIVDVDPRAPALITFTSGSTGEPKAVVRTHANLTAQHAALEQSLLLSSAALDLVTLPILVLANLASGVPTLLPSAVPGIAPDAARLSSEIKLHQPTRITTSPAILDTLSQHCLERDFRIDCVQQILVGGAPVFPQPLEPIHAAFPSAELRVVYGATEAEPIAHVAFSDLAPEDLERMSNGAGLLAGCPVPAIRLAILKNSWGQRVGPFTVDAFHAACRPPSSPGEIVVSGEHVLASTGDANGKRTFSVGDIPWHRTGDAGYLDEHGRLWLLGRCEACPDRCPEGLYPLPAESKALQHPGVDRAAFMIHRGRAVLAVQPKPGESVDLAALRTSFGHGKLDEVLECRIPFDRRLFSKTDYPALRAILDER